MNKITTTDLTKAASRAFALAEAVGEPPVVGGGLALAAHGYQRETDDVDIVVAAIIGGATGNRIEVAADNLLLTVRARHKFGGLDLRDGPVHVDVLTLDNEAPGLADDAVREAVGANRKIDVFGYRFFAVSIGHLLCMKLIAERRKDKADIVELIKARIGTWDDDWYDAAKIVKTHLGSYAVRTVERFAAEARGEL